MTEKERQVVVDLLRSAPSPASLSVTELRAMFEQTGSITKQPEDVVLEKAVVGGVPAEWSSTPGAESTSVLLYLHGGGFYFGSAASHRGLVTNLGALAGVRTLTLEYRLAPEHRFPSPIEDAVAGYRDLLDQGLEPARIAVAGDSAGGGLLISMLVAAREAGLPLPGAAVCFSPWVDMMFEGDSMRTNQALDAVVGREELSWMADQFIAVDDRRDPRASPILADLTGFPPALIQVSSHEVLLDDGTRLAARLAAADVRVQLDVWPRLPHVWQLYAGMLSEGWDALEQAADFLRKQLR
ncbi:alpha/beta hydrolase [Nocardia sp. NPDC005745]|uniref:alpha/beta hydrolase n=1 Tax=Nocardia sp. NPDC005745 TaxID=3157061 RepID=UPI0033F12181